MRTKYKPWAKPFIEENPTLIVYDNVAKDSETFKEFLAKEEIYLEIGPGKGMFITTLAKKFPDKYFIIVEKCLTVSAICAKLIKEEGLNNVFMISGDIFNMFELIKDNTFDAIFINHPDPWPKKRHEKRRLTYKIFLDQYKRILKKDAKVFFKTDNADLFDFSVESFKENNWTLSNLTYDYKGDVEFDALTNYEKSFIEKNVPIKRLEATFKEEK